MGTNYVAKTVSTNSDTSGRSFEDFAIIIEITDEIPSLNNLCYYVITHIYY